MARPQRRVSGRRRSLRRPATGPAWLAFAALLVMAVLAMHGLVGPTHTSASRAAAPAHSGMPTPGVPTSGMPTPEMTMAGSAGSDSQMSSGDHCAILGHHCLSLRAIDFPSLEPAVVPILVFAALLFAMVAVWIPAVRPLGRPPPWAIRDHLCLNVIRC